MMNEKDAIFLLQKMATIKRQIMRFSIFKKIVVEWLMLS
jgi:hypothetical protein